MVNMHWTNIYRALPRPADAAPDYGAWRRLSLTGLRYFGLLLALFSVCYYFLDWLVGEARYFRTLQLYYSRLLVLGIGAIVGYLVLGHWLVFKGVVARFLFESVAPQLLALLRMALLFKLAGHLFYYVPTHLAAAAAMPYEARAGLPYANWYIQLLPINPDLYQVVSILGGVSCLLAGVGLFTRPSLIVATLAIFYVLGVPNFYGKVNHTHFMLWAPAILAFSPAGAALSIDAWWRYRRDGTLVRQPHYAYGLPLKVILLQLGFVYFFSAIGKLWLGGLQWALSDNLIHLMHLEWLEQYDKIPALRIDRYPWLCRLGAMGVICFELLYIFLILTPVTRVVALVGAIGFHGITGYFLTINFKFLQLLNALSLNFWAIYARLWRGLPVLVGWLVGGILFFLFRTIDFIGGLVFLFGLFAFWQVRRPEPAPFSPVVVLPARLFAPLVVGLLSFNFLFGLNQITSWPFSAYPSYSFVRTGEVRYVWFIPQTATGDTLDLNQLGQQAAYRKENILPLAEQAVNLWNQQDTIAFRKHTLNYWLLFREQLPALKAATGAAVVLQEFSTNPDSLAAPRWEVKIGEISRQAGEWQLQF